MIKSFSRLLFTTIVLFPFLLWSQGAYYNGIDTGSASFVTDLHNLIYPHTKISYDQFDETNVANFASRDTTGGQKVVTCVYSGQIYVYTPPFAWGTFSREHTWCHSWMPTHPSTSGPEYSDQHHLFPTNQNNANGVRSNHPEGIVVIVTSSYLQCKYGKDVNGDNVFEPRDSHKGDMARSLLYMAVCYNGVNGNDWTFNHLNTVTLPALSEAPQNVDLLLQWNYEDPPDQWEKDRNDYIYSIQGNRNPFVDHPEYVNVIDFNTLTKKSPISIGGEPTNYPSGYNTPTLTSNSIKITWSDPGGAILPTGYLLKASTTNTFTDPVNGVEYSNQSDLSGGTAEVNIAYGTGQYTFSGLTASSSYYFKLFPYNGNITSRIYKTASFPSSLQQGFATTAPSSGGRISISSSSFTYTEDFDELANSGTNNTWTDSVTINGWYTSRTLYSAATGSSNSGALYSFGSITATDRSLGSIASGSTGTILYAVRFVNNSGSTITSLPITYTGKQWRNGGNTTPQKLVFEYKINAASITDAGVWSAVPALDFISPIATATAAALDGNNVANKTAVASTIPLSLADGDEIWFRWTDINDAGNDHALAIDGFELNVAGSMLPVELSSFTGKIFGTCVVLDWSTASEANNYGFVVERKTINNWTQLGFVGGAGNSSSPKNYSFVDATAKGKNFYRLKQIDNDGKFEYHGDVEVMIAQMPQKFTLSQNYPNPFNPTTTISFTIPVSGFTTLKVYDAIGREVATLINRVLEAGVFYEEEFRGSDLPSGIYFARLESNGKRAMKKMMLVK